MARRVAGLVLVAGAGTLAVLGSWPASMWPLLVAVCALPLAVQLRLRETDRLLIHGEEQNRYTRRTSRNYVVDAAHSTMSAPLTYAVRQARTSADHSMFELLVTIRSSLQELTHLGKSADADIEWPGVLVEPIQALCRQSGQVLPEVRILVDELVGDDRDFTRLTLFDLVGNAVTAGARRVAVVVNLQPDGRTLQIEVADDAGPFPDGAWQDDSGGLGRLRGHLEDREGRLELHPAEGPLRKSVIAAWPMAPGPNHSQRD